MTFPSPSSAPNGIPVSIPAYHWRRKRRLTLQVLAAWLLSTFSVIYFARDLSGIRLFGWPLSYYMAAQGLALVYLALVVIYNRRIRHLEAQMKEQMEQRMNLEREVERHGG